MAWADPKRLFVGFHWYDSNQLNWLWLLRITKERVWSEFVDYEELRRCNLCAVFNCCTADCLAVYSSKLWLANSLAGPQNRKPARFKVEFIYR